MQLDDVPFLASLNSTYNGAGGGVSPVRAARGDGYTPPSSPVWRRQVLPRPEEEPVVPNCASRSGSRSNGGGAPSPRPPLASVATNHNVKGPASSSSSLPRRYNSGNRGGSYRGDPHSSSSSPPPARKSLSSRTAPIQPMSRSEEAYKSASPIHVKEFESTFARHLFGDNAINPDEFAEEDASDEVDLLSGDTEDEDDDEDDFLMHSSPQSLDNVRRGGRGKATESPTAATTTTSPSVDDSNHERQPEERDVDGNVIDNSKPSAIKKTRRTAATLASERMRLGAALSHHRRLIEEQDRQVHLLQHDLERTTTVLAQLGLIATGGFNVVPGMGAAAATAWAVEAAILSSRGSGLHLRRADSDVDGLLNTSRRSDASSSIANLSRKASTVSIVDGSGTNIGGGGLSNHPFFQRKSSGMLARRPSFRESFGVTHQVASGGGMMLPQQFGRGAALAAAAYATSSVLMECEYGEASSAGVAGSKDNAAYSPRISNDDVRRYSTSYIEDDDDTSSHRQTSSPPPTHRPMNHHSHQRDQDRRAQLRLDEADNGGSQERRVGVLSGVEESQSPITFQSTLPLPSSSTARNPRPPHSKLSGGISAFDAPGASPSPRTQRLLLQSTEPQQPQTARSPAGGAVDEDAAATTSPHRYANHPPKADATVAATSSLAASSVSYERDAPLDPDHHGGSPTKSANSPPAAGSPSPVTQFRDSRMLSFRLVQQQQHQVQLDDSFMLGDTVRSSVVANSRQASWRNPPPRSQTRSPNRGSHNHHHNTIEHNSSRLLHSSASDCGDYDAGIEDRGDRRTTATSPSNTVVSTGALGSRKTSVVRISAAIESPTKPMRDKRRGDKHGGDSNQGGATKEILKRTSSGTFRVIPRDAGGRKQRTGQRLAAVKRSQFRTSDITHIMQSMGEGEDDGNRRMAEDDDLLIV